MGTKAKNAYAYIYSIYNFFLHGFAPALAVWLSYRLLVQRKGRGALPCWIGSYPQEWRQAAGTPRLWVHAVSVGEVMAAKALIGRLREVLPKAWVLLTVVTDSGMRTAQRLVKDADALAYLPLDLPLFVHRAMERVQPQALMLIETELWPNLLHAAKQRGVKVVLANGRVSDAVFVRARGLAKPFYHWVLSYVDAFAMRTELDGQRLKALGVEDSRVRVMGDVKLDMPGAKLSKQERQRLRQELNFDDAAPVWIAGSTHEGEDEVLMEAHRRSLSSFPTLRFIIAPRHIERVPAVEKVVGAAGFSCVRRTQFQFLKPQSLKAQFLTRDETSPDPSCAQAQSLKAQSLKAQSLKAQSLKAQSLTPPTDKLSPPVVILDTVGELSKFYAIADVAFVGGSLIPRGGHNLLEPIVQGVPVIYGSSVDNFRTHAALIEAAGVGFQVKDVDALTQTLMSFLVSPNRLQEIATRCEEIIRRHRGAARRVAEWVASLITSGE